MDGIVILCFIITCQTALCGFSILVVCRDVSRPSHPGSFQRIDHVFQDMADSRRNIHFAHISSISNWTINKHVPNNTSNPEYVRQEKIINRNTFFLNYLDIL